MSALRTWIVTLAVALIWMVALLQWGQPLHWDELEFFRATRWTAEGRVPFRDFWEHHLPLQWLLFSPVAALVSDGPGAQSVLALRWAQLPLWVAVFACVVSLMRRAGLERWERWGAIVLLLSSYWFVRTAVQYRLDVPGHAAYLGALWLVVVRRGWPASLTSGALFALAVLANMRLAPLVVITLALVATCSPDEERWSWNREALGIAAGGAAIAAVFVIWLRWTAAMPGFAEGVLWYNPASDELMPGNAASFLTRLAGPILQRDAAGAVLLVAALAGAVLALRKISRPGVLQMTALLGVAALAIVASFGIEYDYHFHTALLLLLPAAAHAARRLPQGIARLLPIVPAASVALALLSALPDFGLNLAYQNRVMLEADRRTSPAERVWDSTGYALRRKPAYRYWFLPGGVRALAERSMIEPYDLDHIRAVPPAAIIFNDRTRWWMQGRPRMAAYVAHHYLPLYQHLWLPGMSAVIGPGPWRTSWVVPRSGRYDVYVSELLPSHPWFSRWHDYGLLRGSELAIPLARLPQAPAASLQWRVNGVAVASTPRELQRGARLELSSSLPNRAGVLIVPHGITTLSSMPEASAPFF